MSHDFCWNGLNHRKSGRKEWFIGYIVGQYKKHAFVTTVYHVISN